MMDMFKFINKLNESVTLEVVDAIQALPKTVNDWAQFLTAMRLSQKQIETVLGSTDSRISYLIVQVDQIDRNVRFLMTQSVVTEDILDQSWQMARRDPRNHGGDDNQLVAWSVDYRKEGEKDNAGQ